MTGFSKCKKTRHKPLLLGDFLSGLCLAGDIPLPENSKSTETSLDTQHFLWNIHNRLSQLWVFCYQCFCACWKHGGWFITELVQPSIRGARGLRFRFINLWEQYLYIKTMLICQFYTLCFEVKKKKKKGLANLNIFCFSMALAVRVF